MRSLLIVCPHFPPVNGADAHRVRTALEHLEGFGWRPRVLAVTPASLRGPQLDPLLERTVPASVPVRRVKAWRFGPRAIGLRAWYPLAAAGERWMREEKADLVFISTTAFPLMTLAARWQRRLGVRCVLDFQDPWSAGLPAAAVTRRGLKHRLMRRLHRRLEPRAVQAARGLIATSARYLESLHAAYPSIAGRPSLTLPFGASAADFELSRSQPPVHTVFHRGDGCIHGVAVGAVSDDMLPVIRVLFTALAEARRREPETFEKVRLHFIGTNYAAAAGPRLAAGIRENGLSGIVTESPARVPYFTALRLMSDADFLIVPGSTDENFTPSKLGNCVLSRRPVLAVMHGNSPASAWLKQMQAAEPVTFSETGPAEIRSVLIDAFRSLLRSLPYHPPTDWDAFSGHTAHGMTRRLCAFFDEVANS